MMETSNAILVSVIMPCYNAAEFIEDAIRSVQAQTLQSWELLVIDDCSCDDTCARVEALAADDARIRLIRLEHNHGRPAFGRNLGFAQSRGKFVALLDSDDLWLPEKLEKQIAAMENSGADFAYCAYHIIDRAGQPAKRDYLVPETADFKSLLGENVIGCSTVVLRSELLETYRFREDLYHEDYALWLQMLRDGKKCVGCTQPLAKWRYIQGSRSFQKGKAAKNRWDIYRNYLRLPLHRSIGAMVRYFAAGLRKYCS